MPVHLQSITRRRFLAGTIETAAALVVSGPVVAAGRKVAANCFVLLSDPHIAGNPGKTARGVNMKLSVWILDIPSTKGLS